MNEHIKIVDVIDHRNKYAVQRMLVLNRFPRPIFTRDSRGLIGKDGPVFQFYKYEEPGPRWKASGGAEILIPMQDGTTITSTGQWWDAYRKEFRDRVYSPGMSTIEQLEDCNVFFGGMHIEKQIVDEWLVSNQPSNNYHKYDKRHADYGKQTIVSPWGGDHD